MLKLDLRVKLGRVTSGAKIAVRAFNYVFENSDYPEIWSHGIISPISKAGEMHCPENYRKITLLSSLGKIFESVLNNRLCFL